MTQSHPTTTFEEKFKAFVPEETRVSQSNKTQLQPKQYEAAGILVKAISYLLDIGISIFILPLIYNIYHYFKRWQTLGQQWMGIRIYRYHSINPVKTIATIPQLLTRTTIKVGFLLCWAIIGINFIWLWMVPYVEHNALSPIFQVVYQVIMLICIHGYAITMWTNTNRRGLHDIRSNTIVAYDNTYQIKKILLGTIRCAVLYYIIFWLGPSIITFIDSHLHGGREQSYRAIRNWIDYRVLTGIKQMYL